MKKLLTLLLLVSNLSFSQTVVQYDYMETWNWAGLWWTPAASAGWFTNASVTPTESAVLYGLGSGTSVIEQDWYSLPNVTGLNATSQYQLKFRLASYTFSNATATTRGVDVADYVSVQVSTNGGVSYVTELRVTGNSNATWPYNTSGIVTHTANGSFTNSAAPTGDVYASPAGASANGPSVITLNLLPGITQVAVDIYCRANSAGEEWWIDNVELIEIPPTPLPVELTYFVGENVSEGNVLRWQTASEHNSDYFLVERSVTGEFNENSIIAMKKSAGNSTEVLDYAFVDITYESAINYYKLVQVDFDGKYKEYGPIAINNLNKVKKVVQVINLMGQPVSDWSAHGVYIEIYEDGTSNKVMR